MPAKHHDFDLRTKLRAPANLTSVGEFDPRATPGLGKHGKAKVPKLMQDLAPKLSDAQERLFARGKTELDQRSVLVVLQGLDTAGKGGVVRHVFGLVDPQGLALKSFKAPTKEELSHHFLWRIEQAVPAPGMIGIFDRSQYEDVLIVRVNELVPEDVWQQRYDEINEFEAKLTASGVTIIKCFLNISPDRQRERLLQRLERPDKHWKYNPGDLDTRMNWDSYMAAYRDVLLRCNPDSAPWYVIPSDRKWYRNWAIAELLHEHMRELPLTWPVGDFDVATEIERVRAS